MSAKRTHGNTRRILISAAICLSFLLSNGAMAANYPLGANLDPVPPLEQVKSGSSSGAATESNALGFGEGFVASTGPVFRIDAGDSLPHNVDAWINLPVYNVGNLTAFNVTVDLALPAGVTLLSGADPQNIGSIGVGGSAVARWKVRATSSGDADVDIYSYSYGQWYYGYGTFTIYQGLYDEFTTGLGTGASGWHYFRNDDYAFLQWRQLPWGAYNAASGSTRPANGDLNGGGADEIILGLGPSSYGWFEIVDEDDTGYAHLAWLQVPWGAYNAAKRRDPAGVR